MLSFHGVITINHKLVRLGKTYLSAMADQEDIAFDKIMELVGNDGKFQKIFNHVYNVGLVCVASMALMNIIMVLNEPEHNCKVPGREMHGLGLDEWRQLTLPL